MTAVVVPLCVAICVTVACAWRALHRAMHQRRRVSGKRLAIDSGLIQLGCALPAGFLAALLHMQFEPGDDFYDVMGVVAGWRCALASPLVSLLVGAVANLAEANRRRMYPTACDRCGYDMRGSAGPWCPECGANRPEWHEPVLAPRDDPPS